ncbi:MAG: hypothetical protein MRT15_08260 [archaeon YNP-LCB-003-016]|uniref:hypothetical protein n=1 Tax=Candidatus Culexarchaeum yellowstonense TaxID=2928963 RepID=UPI0026EF2C98|nr:hypothetical protein [Candidatus Culexarchaeum yellowstonense]MCR6692370.1 hypothetical protein [Candidatus Culexarchaeum yellowstonense]
MGTRSEIHIRDLSIGDVIELWKHWDGYPKYMVPLFKEFAVWIRQMVKEQVHWLSYPEDVAAYLIAFEWEKTKEWIESLDEDERRFAYLKPDIRPRGRINDVQYVYILDVGNTWTLKGYRCEGLELSDEERKMIREGREDEIAHLRKVCEEKILEIQIAPTIQTTQTK